MGTLPVQSAGPVGTGQLVVPVTTARPGGQSARDPQQPKSVGSYRKGGNDLKGTSSRCSTCPWFHIFAQRCQTRRLRRWPVPRRSGPPSRRVRAVPAFGNYPKNKTGLPPGAEGEEAGGGAVASVRSCVSSPDVWRTWGVGERGASGSVGCRRAWGVAECGASGSVGCRRAWGVGAPVAPPARLPKPRGEMGAERDSPSVSLGVFMCSFNRKKKNVYRTECRGHRVKARFSGRL